MSAVVNKQACKCAQYTDLEDYPAVEKRRRVRKKIIAGLTQIAEHANGKNILYQCSECGQQWQTSMEWMGGNTVYIYKVPSIDLAVWAERPFVCPADIFIRMWRVFQYLEKIKFIEKPELCKSPGCPEHAIRMSGLCAFHHMENLGIKGSIPEGCTWFGPYIKDNYEFNIERLKTLPNYRAL